MKINESSLELINFEKKDLFDEYHYMEKCEGEDEFNEEPKKMKGQVDGIERLYEPFIAYTDQKEYYIVYQEQITKEDEDAIRNSCPCDFCDYEKLDFRSQWYNPAYYFNLIGGIELMFRCACCSGCLNGGYPATIRQRNIDSYRERKQIQKKSFTDFLINTFLVI
jgi:hypothetical protein